MSRPELSQPKDWVGKMLRTALLAVAIFELLAVQTSGLAGADFDGQALQGKIRGDSGILPLQHKYAQMNGSSFHNGGRHMTREHYELLKRHDRRRARRFLSSIANFPLRGQADPDAQGLYYTQVELGSPPRTFYVQVDTGSDLMWVYCSPCSNCPSGASGFGFEIQQYDPQRSSTSQSVGCGDAICSKVVDSTSETCRGALCEYTMVYGDRSSTSGYVVSDFLTYRELHENSTAVNASARVVFGCGDEQTGDLLRPDRAVDGIMGFGQSAVSISSQLYNLGKTPNVFAHCLEGEGKGGGIMVLGSVEEPNLAYTPLVTDQVHYNVYLEGIAVAGVNLTIDASAFATDRGRGTGTIFDSGTTLALLSSSAFVQTYNAIRKNMRSGVRPRTYDDLDCYVLPSGSQPEEYFPSMTLYFRNAPMELSPRNYLFELGGRNVWCFGWQESTEDLPLTILGDIVLKDRIVEYDNVNKRIGFKDYNCTSSVRVSADQDRVTVLPASINSGLRNIAPGFRMPYFLSLGWLLILLT